MQAGNSDKHDIIYLDHGASSWPKPTEVVDAVTWSLTDLGGNPGRGVYELAMKSARAVFDARSACARLLGVPHAEDLAFVPSCTFGCNLMLRGLLSPGDRVVVGSMEHNAVVRPLNALAERGIEVAMVQADETGFVDPDEVEHAVQAAATRAIVCQHASNLTGTIQPIRDLADIARQHGTLLLVDGAQGAGHLDVDLASLGADAYAMSGHKGLLGPQGIGLVYLSPDVNPEPLLEGGTGSGSSDLPRMPSERPDRYEAGTLNTPGVVGLGAAAQWQLARGSTQRGEERRLARMLHEGLAGISGIRVLGPPPNTERVPVVSFTHETVESDRIAFALDKTYNIACRAGLHCTPWSHNTVGTRSGGAVRFGVGYGVSAEDIQLTVAAVAKIVR